MVAYELSHRMRNKRRDGVNGSKIGISKAYDWVEWRFLQNIMLKLGLDWRWVQLAIETIDIATYSVLINGELKGFVTLSWGIKQGNPLSPYLFLLCAERLLALLTKATGNHLLKVIMFSQNGVCISHLLLADDNLLFYQAIVEKCQRLLDLL